MRLDVNLESAIRKFLRVEALLELANLADLEEGLSLLLQFSKSLLCTLSSSTQEDVTQMTKFNFISHLLLTSENALYK